MTWLINNPAKCRFLLQRPLYENVIRSSGLNTIVIIRLTIAGIDFPPTEESRCTCNIIILLQLSIKVKVFKFLYHKYLQNEHDKSCLWLIYFQFPLTLHMY